MGNKGTRRACIFCGSDDLSGEHLFPCWLQRVLPSDDPIVHIREIGEERHEWTRRPFREKTKFVCHSCNGGWMSDLENAARPILEPAIRYERTLFPASAQAIAATWAYKTCLVFQGSQIDHPLAPQAHFAWMRERQLPPPQATIWIASNARVRNDPIDSIFIQKPLALRKDDDQLIEGATGSVHLCFLAVGGLSFIVIAHRYRHQAEITYGRSLHEALDQIWPNPSGVVFWPPGGVMLAGEVLDILTLPPQGFTITFSP